MWEQDPKLEKIAKLLWDERRLDAPTVEDHRKFRQQAEEILGPEESLFRIDWVSRQDLPPVICSSNVGQKKKKKNSSRNQKCSRSSYSVKTVRASMTPRCSQAAGKPTSKASFLKPKLPA